MNRRQFLKILGQSSASLGAGLFVERVWGFPITTSLRSESHKLFSWGQGDLFPMSDATSVLKPKLIFPRHKWVDIQISKSSAAGSSGGFGFGTTSSGQIFCWGNNSNGQLGNAPGTTVGSTSTTPVLFGTTGAWQSISVGNKHVAALKNDGTLWAWGENLYGQLGNGNYVDSSTPIQIGALSNWQKVFAGNTNTLALNSAGNLFVVGSSSSGALGLGGTTTITSLNLISAGWRTLAAGTSHIIGIKTDGTLWGWGLNNYGQLGINSTTNQSAPVQIGIASNWDSVATADGNFSFAINTPGNLFAFGYNGQGQLGLGTSGPNVLTPTLQGSGTWLKVVGGRDHALGIKPDNTLWAWGDNPGKGTFGNGIATQNTSSPIQIGTKLFTDIWAQYYSSAARRK